MPFTPSWWSSDRGLPTLVSRWDSVGEHRIHVRTARGAGAVSAPPIVLVHGLGVSHRYMMPLGRRLAPCFPVLAPDLPGFGQSSRPPRALTLRELADVLADWLDQSELERPYLVGNSMGCQVIVDLAARRPGRLGGVVLVGPTIDRYARSMLLQAVRLVRTIPREPPLLAWIVSMDYLRCGPVRLWKTFRSAIDDPVEEKLPLLDLPALVINGARDPIVSPQWAAEVVALLPQGSLVTLPNVAHAAHFDMPDWTADLVTSFVRRSEQARV